MQLNQNYLIKKNLSLNRTGELVLAQGGRVSGWAITNTSLATRYVKIYDKLTLATSADTPKLTIPIAAGKLVHPEFHKGIEFKKGISWRACTGIADNDNTNTTAGDVVATLFYT